MKKKKVTKEEITDQIKKKNKAISGKHIIRK